MFDEMVTMTYESADAIGEEITSIDSMAALGAIAGIGTAMSVISIAITVLLVIANCKIFQKAGESWWLALIPIVGTWFSFKIITGSGAKMFLMLIPIFNIIYLIVLRFKLAKAFGYSGLFGLGLLFVPNVFQLILAFGNHEYVGA